MVVDNVFFEGVIKLEWKDFGDRLGELKSVFVQTFFFAHICLYLKDYSQYK